MPEATKVSTYCLVVSSRALVGSCVTATEVNPPRVSEVPPRLITVDPMVNDELVRALLGMSVSVFVDPLIDLFVNVCVPVNVATVESMAIVTAAPPLNDVPLSPVPMVSAFVVLAVIVADPPNATVLPLKVTLELDSATLGMFVNVLDAPDIDLLVRV